MKTSGKSDKNGYCLALASASQGILVLASIVATRAEA
jgi:hypothetical protein